MSATTMPRKDRLRRAVILTREFARNLAYLRAVRASEHQALLDPARGTSANFWILASNNCLAMAVLEWCKLFGDPKGKHYWRNIVTEPESFRTNLLVQLGIDEGAFQEEVRKMRRYRDKFLAHLDSDYVANVPALDVAKEAVWFYHGHLVAHEASPGDLDGLSLDLPNRYEEELQIAESVFRGCSELLLGRLQG